MAPSLQAPFGWMGGKSRLRARLALMIPEQESPLRGRKLQRYVEVFGGAAWLLLYKKRWATSEVYNDINEELVNLFSVIRYHPDALIKELELIIHSQKLFNYYKNTLHLTDIHKATATLLKYGWSFSAHGHTYSFYAHTSPKKLIERITKLQDRFAHVAISNESFEKSLKRWNKANTFIYLDPPYYGSENVYSNIGEFGIAQHIELANLLKISKATWMLSYGEHPIIRDLYKDFYITECTVKYSGLGNAGKNQYDAKELIITNYEPPEEAVFFDKETSIRYLKKIEK